MHALWWGVRVEETTASLSIVWTMCLCKLFGQGAFISSFVPICDQWLPLDVLHH